MSDNFQKLDSKDCKILYELDVDARQPLSRIAKKVMLSREGILYRVRKLKESGVIRKYLTIINMSKLGFTHHKIFVKLHNITKSEESDLINDLVSNPFVSWVASCDGKYSLIFGVKSRNMVEFSNIMNDIENKYWRYFMNKDISTIVESRHFYRNYLVEDRKIIRKALKWGGVPEKNELGEIDECILDELAIDSRVSSVDISGKLKISADSVIRRIKKMEKSGIIEHYMIFLNNAVMGQQYFKILISLHSMNRGKRQEMISYCHSNPNIIYIVESVGPWQMEMDVEVKNMADFRKMINDFSNKFTEVINDYSVLNVYDEYKFRLFDKKIFT